jgi:hypothetical protein
MGNAIRRLLRRGLIGLFVLFLVASTVPNVVWAAVYGSGNYSAGHYNVGETQVEPPSQEPTASSEPSFGSKRSSVPSCSATKPTAVPDLFQINAQATSVTLYVSPVLAPRDRYVVSYGTDASAEQHAFEWITDASGVIAIEIQSLQPHTAYHFKVRAGNGCQPGDWSNVLSVSSGQRFPSYRWSSLPRIVVAQVTRRLHPATVERIQLEGTTQGTTGSPAPVPSTKPDNAIPLPTQVPTSQQPQAAPSTSSPTLIERVAGFLNRLFGR